MNNSKSEFLFGSYGYELAFLLQQGGYYLEKLYHHKNNKAEDVYSEWSNQFNQNRKIELDDEQLQWLWKSLISEPIIRKNLKSLIEYKSESTTVLPIGEKIDIFLKKPTINKKLNPSEILFYDINTEQNNDSPKSDGIVLLESDLSMKKRGKFFQCCAIDAKLILKVKQPKSIKEEAEFLQKEPEQIKIDSNTNTIEIDVSSLRSAYALTDRRKYQDNEIKKEKNSNTSSIYKGNLIWINDGNYISLEDIRKKVEKGTWKVPNKK